MLTDREIAREISKKNIIIEPFRKEMLAPAAYYFTLGSYLLIPDSDQLIQLTGDDDPTYKEINIESKGYIIKPNEFLLGQTAELLTLGNNIGMFLDGLTTLARLGLTIHKTASFVHPGHHKSIITLEIKNNGNHDIELVPGIKIGKGIFFKAERGAGSLYKDVGIYASQLKVTGADVPPYRN